MNKRAFRGITRGPRNKLRKTDRPKLSAKQRKHLKQFGELHPADSSTKDNLSLGNYSKVAEEEEEEALTSSSESEEEEEPTPFVQLLHLMGASAATDENTTTSDEDGNDDTSDNQSSDTDDENQNNIQKHSDVCISSGDADDAGGNSEADEEHRDSHESKTVNTRKVGKVNKEADVAIDNVKDNSDSDSESHYDNDIQRKTGTTNVGQLHSEEEVLDEGESEVDHQLKEDDPFSIHFERDLPESLVERLSATQTWESENIKVKSLGAARFLWKETTLVSKTKAVEKDLKKIGVKYRLTEQVAAINIKECNVKVERHGDVLTSLQRSLFQIMNKYEDLLYPQQNHKNIEQIRLAYCLHAVNHVLKTRSRVISHNTKIRDRASSGQSSDVEYRDQGLTRPKVLVLVPTRHGAFRVISLIISLLSDSDQAMVSRRKRFKAEYGPEGHDDDRKGLKPEDYDATFSGNIDEDFRMGLSVSKKSIRLFSPFYMADIIIGSPLGLRRVIGAPGDKARDYDFLSSIEILIMDQTDFFFMQNWDHVLNLLEHMHLQPRQSHGVDFSRTRMWTLNGWAKHYRQTLIFSSILMPEILTIFNKHCHNYAGKVQVHRKTTTGTVCQVAVQLPQMFHKVECTSCNELHEARFQFFLKEVLPEHREKDMKQTLIYIPSYYDAVRIRNYFVKEAISFTHISEYDNSKGIRRARLNFKRRKAQFMLYTGRVHFYRRFKLRGPKHIIFYELPLYPHFYSELCNLLEDPGRISATSTDMLTCTVIYSRFDVLRLREVVGTVRADRMINSDKTVHMLVSGENS